MIGIGAGVYYFVPEQYPKTLLPKLSSEEHQKRCALHKSDQDCKADPYCEGVEVTPVCIDGKDGQVCLDGGYVCHPKSELTKKPTKDYSKIHCNNRMTQEECETTTECGWEPQPGAYKCVTVSQERQDF